MSINLTKSEIEEIQRKYGYLVNYESNDPSEPIDPLTYTDSGGDHLLHIAAFRGDLHTVEVLVKIGIDVNMRGELGCTPLHYARMGQHKDVIEFLIKRGAQPSLKNELGVMGIPE